MKKTWKRVLAFLFAFAMVVSLLPVSIVAEDNGETLGAEVPEAELPAEAPAQEPEVAQQKINISPPVETPAPVVPGDGSIEIGGGGSIVKPSKNPGGLPSLPTNQPGDIIRPTATPGTGHKITFNGNGGHLHGVAAGAYSTKSIYEPEEEVKISVALAGAGREFIHDLSADYSTNYRLTGWNTKKNGTGTSYSNTDTLIMPDADVTLYAQWEAYEWIHWNITLGEGGDHIDHAKGSNVKSFKAYCGNVGNSAGMVPAAYYSPVKAFAQDDFIFVGWYYGEQLITEGNLVMDTFRNLPKLTMATSGATLEARFVPAATITYKDGVDGVAFADQVHKVAKGSATPAFEGTPTRNNCEFAGWEPEVAELATEDAVYAATWTVLEPADPKYNTPDELFKVACTSDESHAAQTWNWFGSHVLYNKDKAWNEERGAWTATAKVNMSQFLYQYQKATGHTHYCTDASGKKLASVNIPLIWNPDQGLWLPDGLTTIGVWCYTQPAAPTKASKLSKGTGIWVQDTDDLKNNTKYSGKNLLDGTYSFGEMTKDEDGNFWCTMTITDLQPYVSAFNTKYNAAGDKAPYIIDEESTTATFSYILKYTGSTTDYKQDGSGWSIDDSSYANNTEKLNGKALYVYSRYVVTYTDGVAAEEIFPDQVYKVKAGETTPAFVGTTEYPGWVFKGWNPTVAANVNADVAYVAQWKQGPSNILRLDGNGGGKNGNPISDTYWNSKNATLRSDGSEFSNPGYRFNGWNTEADGTGTTYVKGDQIPFNVPHNGEVIVLYAQWVTGPANVLRLVGNGGTVYGENTYDVEFTDEETHHDVAVGAAFLNRDNYYCIGWNTEADGTGDTVNSVTFQYPHNGEVITLYAQWRGQQRTIHYVDGEDNKVFDQETYSAPYGDPTPAFQGSLEREGYLFIGWSPEVSSTVSGNVTYTAQWAVAHKVTYTDGVSGEAFADQEYIVRDGAAVPAFAGTPQRAGFKFLGWDVADVPEAVTEDITFTAQWEVINDSDVPNTGDSDRILRPAVLMGAVMLLCAAGAMMVANKRREQEN